MPPPNVVFIMSDNQGAWTLGSHGNPDIRTPHLDRLAAEGLRCERAYCVNSVCSPCRATCLTGLIPSQHGVHTYLGMEKPDAQMGPDAYCTIGEFRGLPEIFADRGYVCGLSGKWHLGDSLHPQKGFTDWLTRPTGHTERFVNDVLIRDGATYVEPRDVTEVFTDHAIAFIERNRARPFFLYVPYTGPYGLSQSMLDPYRNRHWAYYRDREMASFPREPKHPWLRRNVDLLNNTDAMRNYAAALGGVDDGVGRLLEALARLGLDEHTLVVYTADQGLCAGHHGMWGMGDHSRPLHTFEEAVHIPMLWRHPQGIPAGRTFKPLTCNYDFFPTLLDYLGLADEIPSKPRGPGTSYAAALRGGEARMPDAIFHDFENTRMIRTEAWKYTRRHPGGPHELYDMLHDPGERTNLAGDPKHAALEAELRARLETFFDRYADPQYDRWRGGRTKASPMGL
ncbi:MAG: sulfatase-like hydrolase/transferase [Planctomycetota bacterium]|nr:sulfatase-like hydrolase/transferase [Planctomycetota bacterium]